MRGKLLEQLLRVTEALSVPALNQVTHTHTSKKSIQHMHTQMYTQTHINKYKRKDNINKETHTEREREIEKYIRKERNKDIRK